MGPDKRVCLTLCFVVLAGLGFVRVGQGEVVRIEITAREPFADGHSFGTTGPYEKLTGRLHFEIDPEAERNRVITDVELAPRNERGKVAFWSDFCLLAPADPLRGNRRLLFGVTNRGNKLILAAFNDRGGNDPTTLDDAGNGFLMRQGYALLWCGWNGDVRPGNGRMQIGLPVATKDGEPITGRIHAEICVDRPSFSEPFAWGNSDPYPVADLDNATATLTMRPDRTQPAVEIPRSQWAFARREDGEVVPDPQSFYVAEGFRPGWLYELVYVGRDPRVTGLGFAAVRDATSFFRHADRDQQGTVNPQAGTVDYAYIFGISQSGRFINHFVYEGFNTDEAGRMVFDAAMPHVSGAGRGLFNYRFGQTTRHGSQHEDLLYPSESFPFNTVPQRDPLTNQEEDAFAKARAQGHLPKMFFTGTSTEYWARAASLLHTDVEGKVDAPVDPNARVYVISGAQHVVSARPVRGIHQNGRNTIDYRPVLRALLVALDRWVTAGEEPPPSRYPRIDDGRLVRLKDWRRQFPKIPGVNLPEDLYRPLRLDFGPRWESAGIADTVPPKVGPAYETLVPAVDEDGNEIAGIRLPRIAVPLATYAGWNLRAADYGTEGKLARWVGSQWPLPRTIEERQKNGDPRLAILERYPTREAYVARIAEAALELQEQRFLLAEDVARILRRETAVSLWDDQSAPAPSP